MLNKAIKSVEVKARKRINIRKEFAEQNRLRKSFERKLRNQLNTYFKKYYNGIADLYEEELPYGQVIRDSQIDLTKILNSHYRQVITSFGERQLRVLEKQENRFESIYQDYVNLVGAERVVGITRSNQKIIQKVINANQDAGVAVVAKEIRASSEVPYTRYRSATIARTETHNAASYANQQTAQSMNIPDQQKQWVTTQDPRSRSTHLQANGQVVPLDEDFIVGGKPMKYPGDPRGGAGNVINCRCVLIYTSPEDVVTDDTTITPKPRQARVIEDTPQQQFMGFGKTIPEEKKWHEVSWSESPDNIKNAIYVLPALSRVTQSTSRRAYYNNSENMIAMGKNKTKLENGKDVWRHEYGHDIDSKAFGILKEYSDKDKYRNLEIRKNRFGKSAFISEYYADEGLRDQKNIKKIFANTYGVDRYSTKGSKIMEDINNKVEKKMAKQIDSEKIDDKWLDANLQDGKIFTKEEILTIIGGRKKITKHFEMIGGEYLKANKRIFFEINELNKEGVLDFKGSFSGTLRKIFIFEDKINDSERTLLFQDFIGSLTNTNLGNGHGKSYYNKMRNQSTNAKTGFSFGNAVESFANYTSLKGIDNDLWHKKMKKYAPETTKAYDDVFDELNTIAIEDPIGLVD